MIGGSGGKRKKTRVCVETNKNEMGPGGWIHLGSAAYRWVVMPQVVFSCSLPHPSSSWQSSSSPCGKSQTENKTFTTDYAAIPVKNAELYLRENKRNDTSSGWRSDSQPSLLDTRPWAHRHSGYYNWNVSVRVGLVKKQLKNPLSSTSSSIF